MCAHQKFRVDPFLKGSREWKGQSSFPGLIYRESLLFTVAYAEGYLSRSDHSML